MASCRFIVVDPGGATNGVGNNTTKTKQVGPLECQVCFATFGSQQDLRDHHGHFQTEAQILLARLCAVQRHLDEADGFDANDDGNSDENTEGDNDGDDDDYGEYKGVEKQAKLQCPDANCKRSFGEWVDLSRHWQIHVPCFEVCVFCRNRFLTVRPFVRHTCKSKKAKNDKAKSFYRKERRTQLRKYAKKRLHEEIHNKGSRCSKKREFDAENQWSDQQGPSKRRSTAASADSPTQIQTLSRSLVPSQTMCNPVQIPLPGLATHLNGTFAPDSLSKMDLSTATNFSLPRSTSEWATIFEDVTITPDYLTQQPPLHFLPGSSGSQNQSSQDQLYAQPMCDNTQHIDVNGSAQQ